MKGVILDPRKNLNPVTGVNGAGSGSEGEVKLGKMNQDNMHLFGGKPSTGVNRIIRASESGEITNSSLGKHFASVKSEGEVDNVLDKKSELTNVSSKIKSSSSRKNKSKISLSTSKSEKTRINLKVSPQGPIKNNIKIKSIRKFLFFN